MAETARRPARRRYARQPGEYRAEAVAAIRLELAGASRQTLATQASLLGRLLRWSDGHAGGKRQGWTRAELQEFFAAEAGAGASQGTLSGLRTALRTYFRAIEEPMPPRLGARLGTRRERPPVMSPADVTAMVAAARAQGTSLPAAMLALSTTYGLRRDELSRARFGAGRLLIRTAKTEAEREHLLPAVLLPWLRGYPVLGEGERAIGLSEASAVFHALRRDAGVAEEEWAGWHSLRRALTTGLMAREDLREWEIEEFMAWRSPGGHMSRHYNRPQAETVDPKVLDPKLHPFLRLWA